MKAKILVASIVLCQVLGVCSEAEAQTPVVRRGALPRREETKGVNPQISERYQDFNRKLVPSEEGISWMRTIYRRLDLTQEPNATLYYPQYTTEQSGNLFASLLRLVLSGQIKAYDYLDGVELFDSSHEVKVKDLLERFNIAGKEERGRFVVAPADIPSAEVKSYYLKETYYFDQATSRLGRRVDALCPILSGLGDYGEVAMPMFWVSYESIRPYISQQLVMIGNTNNVASSSLDDYFRMGVYQGEIVKTLNLQGLSMAQLYPTPDSLALAQKKLDEELRNLPNRFFVADSLLQNHTAPASTKGKTTRSTANSRDKRVRSESTSKVSTPSTPKASAKAPATPRRSVRGRG